MSDKLDQFLADIDRLEAAVPEIHRNAQVALFALGYQVAIENTPVKTGALRAENIVIQGDPDSPAGILYEHPSRPGPDAVVPFVGAVEFEPPSADAARVAMADVPPFSLVSAANYRFYAASVHNSGRPWMDHASDYVELIADSFPIREWK